MALAKYFEEIEERWLEGTQPSYEHSLTEWMVDPRPRQPAAGEVYLLRGGRRMEDVEVCAVGEAISLSVVQSQGGADAVVEMEGPSGFRTLRRDAAGLHRIKEHTPATRRLQVSSGGYMKSYTVHFVVPFAAETLPAFARGIRELTENPPRWTERTFTVFRAKLEDLLCEAGVPELFRQGVVEYHLSLFHEEMDDGSFRDRLEAAHGALRWFIPYSDIARLACAFFLFRANEFEAALRVGGGRHRQLARAARFFSGSEARRQTGTEPAGGGGRPGPSLLVPQAEALCMDAIEELTANQPHEALRLVAEARRMSKPALQRERMARLDLLETRAQQCVGGIERIRQLCEALQHSPWPAFAAAARTTLSENHHP